MEFTFNGWVADARADIPDREDLIYQPSLGSARAFIDPRQGENSWWLPGRVRDQGDHPSCTGHAVAAAVDNLLALEARQPEGYGRATPRPDRLDRPYASAFMLYGNAQLHDEWDGEGYSGSSLRGALKGFRNNGLCSIKTASDAIEETKSDPKDKDWRWFTNRSVYKEARQLTLGAYYRVPLMLTAMHSALEESGVLLATSAIHSGWVSPGYDGKIAFNSDADTKISGYHAFVIIGYNREGWLIQNSWGTDWGQEGTALWTYEDWADNVSDVWAIRLSAQVIDGIQHSVGNRSDALILPGHRIANSRQPTRLEVLGHLLPIEDGRLVRYGRYHHDVQTLMETTAIIKRKNSETDPDDRKADKDPSTFRYQHLLIHSLGGGRNEIENARMVRILAPIYRANGIYPVFLQWEEPVWQDLGQQMTSRIEDIQNRYDGDYDVFDKRIMRLIDIEAAGVPARHWENLEESMKRVFFKIKYENGSADQIIKVPQEGAAFLSYLFQNLDNRNRNGTMSYHLAGHDLGAIFSAELLANTDLINGDQPPLFSTLHLIGPLIDDVRFEEKIRTFVSLRTEGPVRRRARRDTSVIEQVHLWTLSQEFLQADRFHVGYDKSWPEFWARVQGIAAANDGVDKSDLELDKVEESGAEFYLRRMLALPRFAEPFVDKLKDDAVMIDHHVVSKMIGELRPQHARLDGVPEVVNGVIQSILGDQAPQRLMSPRDWKLSL